MQTRASKATEEAKDFRHLIEVRDVPGMGKGVFAKVSIPAGTPVLRETSLWPNFSSYDDDVPALEVLSAFHTRLTDSQKSHYLTLHGEDSKRIRKPIIESCGKDWDEIDEVDQKVLSIFYTNRFGNSIHLLGSRFNHSCAANTEYMGAFPGSDVVTFHTVRDIEKDEQLTMSYINPLKLKDKRRKKLRAWKVECRCSHCENTDESEQMEERRREVRELEGRTIGDDIDPLGPDSLDLYTKMADSIDILLPIGHPLRLVPYANALKASLVSRDWDLAMHWAHKRLMTLKLVIGEDDERYAAEAKTIQQLKARLERGRPPFDTHVKFYCEVVLFGFPCKLKEGPL